MLKPGDETYPGTDLLIRICYSCDKVVEDITDLWVDTGSNCCICTQCRNFIAENVTELGMMGIRPASVFWAPDVNQIDED